MQRANSRSRIEAALHRAEICLAACLLGWSAPLLAQDFPPNVSNPDQAITDWRYNDPVFFWRLASQPEDPFEPPDWFYWPDAVIEGAPAPFLPQVEQGRETISPAALRDMEAWAEARKSNVLIVIHKGQVLLERYWNDTRPDQLLNGRAISRSVTPMVLGFAAEDGKLSLDDPIGKFITEWQEDPRGKISIRQLAQNVSGLEVARQMPADQIEGNKDLCLVYCGDVVRAALAYDLVTAPGTRFEVAQENMQLLALVIERATGTPIQTLVSRHIWQPMGGSNATFQFDRPGGTARTMCCMRATARDWTRLGVLLANQGKWQGRQVVPASWIATMATPSARNANFGLGLWLGSPFVEMRGYFEGQPGVIPQSEPFLADDVRIMEGGGFRIVHAVPSQELVIFRHGQFVDDWDTAFLVNTAIRGMQKGKRR
ncbi:serine hydrolase [Altererythrobacter sp. BO-6]|uniref:serine hydrolase domain-containing protein n=1 Tax=Altererythrobacter sp. BO-6 TaxID=2604537 RepID=UPI0013E1BF09|nr:serine hydrolase [Altererythrobacter sp. BO-6]QIG53606.1 serine hydrolase [Altererythrobacter sp. BO-6]